MERAISKTTSLASLNKFEQFEGWLIKHGARLDSLEIREYDTPADTPPGIELVPSPMVESERGIHTKDDIQANHVILSIPRECIITMEMGQALPIGQQLMASNLEFNSPKHIYLIIYMLWDRKVHGAEARYHHYYENLPQHYHNFPIFWTPDELEYLTGSFLLAEIAHYRYSITEDYELACKASPEVAGLCTLEEFIGARAIVTSRNFALTIKGTRVSSLVPYADMMNHKRPCETRWAFDDATDAFVLHANVDLPAGSQVFESYGKKSNHRFLLNYGFSLENNFDTDGSNPNQVDIELEVMVTDPIFQKKMEFWRKERCSDQGDGSSTIESVDDSDVDGEDCNEVCGECEGDNGEERPSVEPILSKPERIFVVEADEDSRTMNEVELDDDKVGEDYDDEDRFRVVRVSVSDDESIELLLSLLRTLACNNEELDQLTGKMTGDSTGKVALPTFDEILEPISLRNEYAAMTLMSETMVKHLARFPTTFEEDVSDLLDEKMYPPFSNRRNAKLQVKGEKEVLCHFLLWSQSAIHLMAAMQQENVEGNELVEGEYQTVEEVMNELEEADLHWLILEYCDDILAKLRVRTHGIKEDDD